MQFVDSGPTFQNNVSPPTSALKGKQHKKSNVKQAAGNLCELSIDFQTTARKNSPCLQLPVCSF
jgi:hypothetical protein